MSNFCFRPFIQRYDVFNEKREAKKLRRLPDNFFLRAFSTISPIGIDFEKQDPITDALLEIRYDLNANMTSYKEKNLESNLSFKDS